jgi:hypothetical protein
VTKGCEKASESKNVLALSDQHVQSGYFFVFALDFLFKPCIVSLESIYINIRANRTTFASGGTRVKCCLRIGFGFPKEYYSLPRDFYVYPSSMKSLIEAHYE